MEPSRQTTLEAALRPKLTDEFLSTLVEVARTGGWAAGDYWEIMPFVQYVFEIAGKEDKDIPLFSDLEPFLPAEEQCPPTE